MDCHLRAAFSNSQALVLRDARLVGNYVTDSLALHLLRQLERELPEGRDGTVPLRSAAGNQLIWIRY